MIEIKQGVHQLLASIANEALQDFGYELILQKRKGEIRYVWQSEDDEIEILVRYEKK